MIISPTIWDLKKKKYVVHYKYFCTLKDREYILILLSILKKKN